MFFKIEFFKNILKLMKSFQMQTIKRYKRVTMKDVLFMMERDRTMVRSTTLFKAYAR